MNIENHILHLSGGQRSRPEPKMTPSGGVLADGQCGICGGPVPPSNGNLNCGDRCRSIAWDWHQAEKQKAADYDSDPSDW